MLAATHREAPDASSGGDIPSPKDPQQALARRYARLQAGLNRFQQETDIRCPEGCGQCCSRTRVTATDVEARAIWGYLADKPNLLSAARAAVAQDPPIDAQGAFRCPLYEQGGRVGCSVYPARPAICRLFGFDVTWRQGPPRVTFCRVLHEEKAADFAANGDQRLLQMAFRWLGANPEEVLLVAALDRRAGGDGRFRFLPEAMRRTRPDG